MWRILGALGIAGALVAGGLSDANAAKKKSKPPIPFTEEMLLDEERISAGREIWQEQCQHCHGAKAYPGKAPKLKPAKYKPGFVYRRATDGFRKMPAFDDYYDDTERMNVEVYIRSDKFSP
ncbi:MAG: cytochrome c [Pseudomonadota bacterium]